MCNVIEPDSSQEGPTTKILSTLSLFPSCTDTFHVTIVQKLTLMVEL